MWEGGKKWAKVFLKAPHLIYKINPEKIILFSLFFFFLNSGDYQHKAKKFIEDPGLFRQGSGMMFMSSELQIPSHLQPVMLLSPFFSFIPTMLPLCRLGWLTSCLVSRFQTWGELWALCDPFWMLVTFHKTVTQTCLLDQYRMTGIPWWSIV